MRVPPSLSIVTGLRRRSAALAGDRSGTVLVLTALMLPLLMGLTGLSVDTALWYAQKRHIQTVADAAAVGGALELARAKQSADTQQGALREALANGYDPAGGDVLTVNRPPASGPNSSDVNAVEAVVQRPLRTFFSSLFLDSPVSASARAVARVAAVDNCVWALNPTVSGALKVAGGATVELNCGIIVNSSNDQALTQSGTTSCLTATGVRVVGNYSGVCVHPSPSAGVQPMSDPLADLAPPPYGACDYTSKITVNSDQSRTLSPGVYCGAIEIMGTGVVSLEPGLYVFDGGGLKVSAQGTLTGSGVTLYLTKNTGPSSNISIQGGATVALSAPTSGPYAGILAYQSRETTGNITHNLTGGSNMRLDGIFYFPKQGVNFSGGSSLTQSASLIVADTMNFTGQSHVGNFEDSPVMSSPYLKAVRLVE